MTPKILLPCLLLGLAEATAYPSCDATTTEAFLEETTEEPAPDIPLELQVQGQSGKFTLVPKGSSGASVGIRVTMDALREVDADGNEVGTSGAVKHSINTFASQDFTVGDMETVRIGSGVSAAKVSFDSTISEIGRIGVDTYVMAQSGTVGMSNESWDVNIGDLKWNIRLWDWTWCDGSNCKQGQTEQVGAFVELDITVQNLGGGSANQGSGKSVSLGSNATLELSTQVQKDCAWEQLPAEFPSISTQGSQTTVTFRFPRFETSCLYDPVLSGAADEMGVDVDSPTPAPAPDDDVASAAASATLGAAALCSLSAVAVWG
mmetsp:Transcript_53564/g.139550  ORF Transcript_53564/g.139550 Transcript_53564/m.139550 type:complete len:319 (+) Transcript_53564:132-1088(+)